MAATKKTDPKTPSGFIRAMPNATPAEITEAAKKAGIQFGKSLIHTVRSYDRKKAGKPLGKPGRPKGSVSSNVKRAPSPAPKPNGKKNGAFVSKADWIRRFGLGVAPAQILAESKKQGIGLTLARIYSVRGELAKKQREAGITPNGARHAAPPKITKAQQAASAVAFKKLVIALGLDQAHALLHGVETSLRTLVAH
jgi:hypothetical protein